MQFSIRREVGFSTYQQDLAGLQGVPIELAFPHRLDEHLEGCAGIGKLAAFVKNNGIVCPSVHAPQGRLTHGGFLSWARDVVAFSEDVGARTVVFHPETVPKIGRTDLQLVAVRHLMELQRETRVQIAVEAFRNAKRVLTPEEVGERGIWMVLDTSHVFEDRALDLMSRYHRTIAGVHLSEMRADDTGAVRPHMPVTDFAFTVLDALKARDWEGTVTLEYLIEYHSQLVPDRAALEALYTT